MNCADSSQPGVDAIREVLRSLAYRPFHNGNCAPGHYYLVNNYVTVDEGGGYYDSGYIQPIDFFGDGTCIPLIVVSPYARKGEVDHTYADHVSILKFIERNWNLAPLSDRSRDNLPNPITSPHDPYVPVNRPAIGDLMNLFRFDGED